MRRLVINTGAWARNAIKEAKAGKINVLASSEADNFNYIPQRLWCTWQPRYLHLTSNNTIFGTQYKAWPSANVPLVWHVIWYIFKTHWCFALWPDLCRCNKNMGPVCNPCSGKNLRLAPWAAYPAHYAQLRTHIKTNPCTIHHLHLPSMAMLTMEMDQRKWWLNGHGITQWNQSCFVLRWNRPQPSVLWTRGAGPTDLMNICFRHTMKPWKQISWGFASKINWMV